MLKQLLRDVGKQSVAPYAVLAFVGVAGAVTYAVARSRLGDGDQRIQDTVPSPAELSSTLASSGRRARHMASSAGLSEKAIATFLATFLAKSAFSFLRWKSEKNARRQGEALASDTGEDFASQLEDHTVKELRGMAAEQDIEGRSSMNKDELVDALSESD